MLDSDAPSPHAPGRIVGSSGYRRNWGDAHGLFLYVERHDGRNNHLRRSYIAFVKIDISVHSTEYTIREIDPNDPWDAGETGLEIHGVTVTCAPADRKYPDKIKGKPGDPAVVVVEHYADGSTFGSSEYAEAKGIYLTRAEAEKAVKRIKTDHGYFGRHIGFLYFDVVLPA